MPREIRNAHLSPRCVFIKKCCARRTPKLVYDLLPNKSCAVEHYGRAAAHSGRMIDHSEVAPSRSLQWCLSGARFRAPLSRFAPVPVAWTPHGCASVVHIRGTVSRTPLNVLRLSRSPGPSTVVRLLCLSEHGSLHPSHVLRLSRSPGPSTVVLLWCLFGVRFRAPVSRFAVDPFSFMLFGRTLRTALLLALQACFSRGTLSLVTPAARLNALCAPQHTLACFLLAFIACLLRLLASLASLLASLLPCLLARLLEHHPTLLACVASLHLLSPCACALRRKYHIWGRRWYHFDDSRMQVRR